MSQIGWIVFGITMLVTWIPQTASLAAKLALTVFCAFLCFLIFGGPQRIRAKKQAKHFASLPQHTTTGYIYRLMAFDTGKKSYISVSDGITQEIGGDWKVYSHSHLETQNVYDGDFLSLSHIRNDKPFIQFRTLPRGIDGTEHKLRYYHNLVEATYITDTDGTNYCLSIRPLEEE